MRWVFSSPCSASMSIQLVICRRFLFRCCLALIICQSLVPIASQARWMNLNCLLVQRSKTELNRSQNDTCKVTWNHSHNSSAFIGQKLIKLTSTGSGEYVIYAIPRFRPRDPFSNEILQWLKSPPLAEHLQITNRTPNHKKSGSLFQQERPR